MKEERGCCVVETRAERRRDGGVGYEDEETLRASFDRAGFRHLETKTTRVGWPRREEREKK